MAERILTWMDRDMDIQLENGTRHITFNRDVADRDLWQLSMKVAPDTVRQVGPRTVLVGPVDAVTMEREEKPCRGNLRHILLLSIMLVALLAALTAMNPVGPVVAIPAAFGLGLSGGLWLGALGYLLFGPSPGFHSQKVTVVRGRTRCAGLVAVVA
jgi:hypothetical protein